MLPDLPIEVKIYASKNNQSDASSCYKKIFSLRNDALEEISMVHTVPYLML